MSRMSWTHPLDEDDVNDPERHQDPDDYVDRHKD